MSPPSFTGCNGIQQCGWRLSAVPHHRRWQEKAVRRARHAGPRWARQGWDAPHRPLCKKPVLRPVLSAGHILYFITTKTKAQTTLWSKILLQNKTVLPRLLCLWKKVFILKFCCSWLPHRLSGRQSHESRLTCYSSSTQCLHLNKYYLFELKVSWMLLKSSCGTQQSKCLSHDLFRYMEMDWITYFIGGKSLHIGSESLCLWGNVSWMYLDR